MSRFYQTAQPHFVDDKMFQLPYELMAKVIQQKDAAVQTEVDAATALKELLTAQALKADEGRRNEKIKGYDSRVQGIIDNITKDPMNYQNYSRDISGLKNTITQDLKMGELSKIEGNYNAYTEWEKEQTAMMKAHPESYDPAQLELLKAKKLQEFAANKGTNYQGTGIANQFDTENLAGMKPTMEFMKEVMDGATQDVNTTVKWDNAKGMYQVKGEKKEKWYSPEMLNNLYIGALRTNPSYLTGLRQRETIGVPGFQGNFDETGSPTLQEGNFLDSSLNTFLTKYGGRETVNDNGVKVSDTGLIDYRMAKEEEKEIKDTEYNNYAIKTVVTGFAGGNITDFNKNWRATDWSMKHTIETAQNVVAKENGYKDITAMKASKEGAALFAALQRGNFSSIQDATTRNQLSAQYKQNQIERAGQKGMQSQFTKDTGITMAQVNKDPNAKAKFNLYLDTKEKHGVNQTMSWEGTGMTQKRIDSFNKNYFGSGMHLTVPLELPAGTMLGKYKIKGGESIKDLVDAGVIEVKQAKSPTVGQGRSTLDPETGLEVAGAPTITYEVVGTKQKINFDAAKSVAPILSYNNDGHMPIGLTFDIDGKTYLARDNSTSSTSIDNFGDVNRPALRTNLILQKWQGAEVEIPNSGGVIYHGVDSYTTNSKGQKVKKYSRGTVSIPLGGGKWLVKQATDPAVYQELVKDLN
jgi:hypothetical protein